MVRMAHSLVTKVHAARSISSRPLTAQVHSTWAAQYMANTHKTSTHLMVIHHAALRRSLKAHLRMAAHIQIKATNTIVTISHRVTISASKVQNTPCIKTRNHTVARRALDPHNN